MTEYSLFIRVGLIYGEETHIKRNSDKAIIPAVEGNFDYQEYLAWLDEGNVPDTWAPTESSE